MEYPREKYIDRLIERKDNGLIKVIAGSKKRSLYYINDSFKKIVVAKTGLNPRFDEEGVMTIDIFDFLLLDEFLV